MLRSLAALIFVSASAWAAEPPRLQLGVEGGYALQYGPRFSYRGTASIHGPQLGFDARYRLAGPLSLGLYGQLISFRSTPDASLLLLADQYRSGEEGRVGLLAGLAHRVGLIDLGASIGLGYHFFTNGRGPTGHVTVTALVALGRFVSLGLYAQALAARDEGRSQLFVASVSGVAAVSEPLVYAWFSMGIRGTVNLL